MSDPTALLAGIRRPRLLIRAARFGVADYNRARDLKRVLGTPAIRSPQATLETLIAEEARCEGARSTGDGSYNVTRHVDVLIALMGEARLLQSPPKAA